MKNKLALSLLSVFALSMTACSEKTAAVKSSVQAEVKDEYYVNSYTLTVEADEGLTVKFDEEATEGKYDGGKIVKFAIEASASVELDGVFLDGIELVASEGKYVFVMPNADAKLKATAIKRSEYDVLNVATVDETKIPSLEEEDLEDPEAVLAALTSIKNIVSDGKAAEGKYLKKGVVKNYMSQYVPLKDLGFSKTNYNNVAYEVGYNDTIIYRGDMMNSQNSNTMMGYYEKGIQNGIYYTTKYNKTPSTTSYSPVAIADHETYLKEVIDDEDAFTTDEEGNQVADYDTTNEIVASEAKASVTQSGILDYALTELFSDSGAYSYLYSKEDSTTKEKTLQNQLMSLSHTVSEDKKSYVLDLLSEHVASYGSEYWQMELKLTVDGDGFISKLEQHMYTYAKDDYDETKPMHLVDGAKPKDTTGDKYFIAENERNYRDELAQFDIESYAMKDYTVHMEYKVKYTSTTMKANPDNQYTITQGGYISSFSFVNWAGAEFEPEIIEPKLVGAQEENAYKLAKYNSYDSKDTYLFDTIGTYHLIFDNWFGEEKVVEVNVIQPLPYSLEVTKDKSYMYTKGENDTADKITVKAEMTPDTAVKDMTLKVVRHDASGDVDVTSDMATSVTPTAPTDEEKEGKTDQQIEDMTPDSQWEISNAKATAGSYTATVTATANATVFKTIDFSIYEKPTIDTVLTNMTTKTLKSTHKGTDAVVTNGSSYYSGCAFYVNLTQDEEQADANYVTGSAEIMELLISTSYYSGTTVKRYTTTGYWRINKSTMAIDFGGSATDYTTKIAKGKVGSYDTTDSQINGMVVLADALFNLNVSLTNYYGTALVSSDVAMAPIDRVTDWTTITTNE